MPLKPRPARTTEPRRRPWQRPTLPTGPGAQPVLPPRRITVGPVVSPDAASAHATVTPAAAAAALPTGWSQLPAAMSARTVAELFDMADVDTDTFVQTAAAAGLVARTVLGQPRYNRADVLAALRGAA